MKHQTDLSNALGSLDRSFGMSRARNYVTETGPAKATACAAARLTLRTRREGGALVIAMGGRIDASNVAKFKAGMLAAIELGCDRGGCDKVIVDMAGLDLISARGLRVLIEAQRRLAMLGGSILLVRPVNRVAQILAISRCDTLFAIKDSIAEALESESD